MGAQLESRHSGLQATDNQDVPVTAGGGQAPDELAVPAVPGLDGETRALLREVVASVANRHPDLRAAILFGSVARGEERPLDDSEPSDVDLLLVFELEPELDRMPLERRLAISHSIGLAQDRYLRAPREINVLTAVRDLADWDPSFVGNVVRDGLLLWAREPLSGPLARVRALSDGERPPAAHG